MKRLLIIEVSQCHECSFHRPLGHSMKCGCDHPDISDKLMTARMDSIPKWCPLPAITPEPK